MKGGGWVEDWGGDFLFPIRIMGKDMKFTATQEMRLLWAESASKVIRKKQDTQPVSQEFMVRWVLC